MPAPDNVTRRLRALRLAPAPAPAASAATPPPAHGPAAGSLIIVGGAMSPDSGIVSKFVELGGGSGVARVVVIPTAGLPTDGTGDVAAAAEKMVRMFEGEGVASVDVLHTLDRSVADSAEFCAPICEATVLFFGGGRQWKLYDAYFGTQVQAEVERLLERGGVVGGSSAGASILGEHMARGDTATNFTMLGDHQVGLGLLANASIDQHFLARNRQFDMLQILEARPELLGVAVDEDTALVVTGTESQVIGTHYVAFYVSEEWKAARGATPWSGRDFILLKAGDTFSLSERQPGQWDSGGLSAERWDTVLADGEMVALLGEGEHMRQIAAAFRNNPSAAVRESQKDEGAGDTGRFLEALAAAQARMEFDEECAVLAALENVGR